MGHSVVSDDAGSGRQSYLNTLTGFTNTTNAINPQGVFNQDVYAFSDDNSILLHIAAGTTVLTSNGITLTQIGIIRMTSVPAFQSGAGIIGFAYDFTPEGITFSTQSQIDSFPIKT